MEPDDPQVEAWKAQAEELYRWMPANMTDRRVVGLAVTADGLKVLLREEWADAPPVLNGIEVGYAVVATNLAGEILELGGGISPDILGAVAAVTAWMIDDPVDRSAALRTVMADAEAVSLMFGLIGLSSTLIGAQADLLGVPADRYLQDLAAHAQQRLSDDE